LRKYHEKPGLPGFFMAVCFMIALQRLSVNAVKSGFAS
jgi:hypothetical protein